MYGTTLDTYKLQVKELYFLWRQSLTMIRIWIQICMDPYWLGSLDTVPEPHWDKSWIRIRIRNETNEDPQHLLRNHALYILLKLQPHTLPLPALW